MAKKMKLPQSMANIQSPFRRLFTLIIFILSSVWCSEASTLIDGIYYNLNHYCPRKSVNICLNTL